LNPICLIDPGDGSGLRKKSCCLRSLQPDQAGIPGGFIAKRERSDRRVVQMVEVRRDFIEMRQKMKERDFAAEEASFRSVLKVVDAFRAVG